MNSKVLWIYERMMPFISAICSKKTKAFLLAICMMLTSTGCGKVIFGNDIASRNLMDDLEDGTSLDMEIDFENSDTAMTPEEANAMFTDFAVRLFQKNMQQQVSSEKEAENILMSPVSVLMALSMTANGARGDTLEQMEHTLGMSVEQLNEFAREYLRTLPNEKNYKFTMANSIWFRDEENRLTVNADFLTKNKAYYHADIYESAFDTSTVKDINSWIAENTDGLITKMLDEIPLDAVMYLINTCMFDAKWQQEYNTSDIWMGDFYCPDGTSQQVDMMHSDENYYLEDKFETKK